MSETAAYNANEVAAVYMSFNRDDLLSSDSGGNLSDESLRNGFYGLSDPLNLRGVLERFEMDLNYGGNTSHYRIRILNPTAELEAQLFGFYKGVFPESLSTMETFENADAYDKRMKAVEDATGDKDEAFLANNTTPAIPRVYLRFGYGTTSEQGLSRIHKAILHDLSYEVKENADKVIELQLADTFTYNKQNNSFNRRDAEASVPILNDDKSLKKPSNILIEVLSKYMQQYPECVPVVDFGSYATKFDDLTFALAAALAEADILSRQRPPGESPETTQEISDLDPALQAEIEALLDRPITSDKTVDRKANGTITQSMLYQAYKQMFEQIGLKWSPGDSLDPAAIEGATAQNQLDQATAVLDQPVNAQAKSAMTEEERQEMANTFVDLNSEILMNSVSAMGEPVGNPPMGNVTKTGRFSHGGSWRMPSMLSFWPMGMEFSPYADPVIASSVWGHVTKIEVSGTLQREIWTGEEDTPTQGTLSNGSTPCFIPGQTDPGQPTREYETVKGLVVTLDGSVNANGLKVVTHVPFDSYGDQPLANSVCPPAPPNVPCSNGGSMGETVDERFNTDKCLWHTSMTVGFNVLGAESNDPPSISNNSGEVSKWEFQNIQGTTNLNGHVYYLYAPDKDAALPGGSQANKYFLIREDEWSESEFDEVNPPIVGAGWEEYGTQGGWSKWEQGGVMLDPGRMLPQEGPKSNRSIRDLTVKEKKSSASNGWGPIWLPAGAVNTKTTIPFQASPQKHRFSLLELDSLTPPYEFFPAQKSWDRLPIPTGVGIGNLPKLKVSMPANNYKGYPGDATAVGKGEFGRHSDLAVKVGRVDPLQSTPILDLNTGEFVEFWEWSGLPEGEYANYVRFVADINGDSWHDEVIPMLAKNPPVIELEPTLETWWYLMFAALRMRDEAQAQELEDQAQKSEEQLAEEKELEEANNKPEKPPQPGKIPPKPITNALVKMGTDGMMPHISAFLQDTINGINKLVVGQTEKLDVMPVQFNKLSTEDLKALKAHAILLEGETWDDDWAKNNFTLLIVGPSDVFKEQYADPIIRPVMSFPQLTSEEYGAPYLFLDYGTANSIVAKIDFDGGTRVLTNMQNSTYAVRQWHDVKGLFDGDATISKDLITKVISRGLQNKIDKLLSNKEADPLSSNKKLEELMNFQKQISEDKENKSEDGEISGDLLDLFPGLVKSFETDSQLQEVIGDNTTADIRILASLISNPKTMNMLFPQANVDGANNEVTNQSLILIDGKPQKIVTKTRILNRKVDFANIATRLGDSESMKKMTDFGFSYANAMQNETFEVNVTTLGLPELDDPMSDFLSRVVVLNFKDARFASGANHWISGVYRVKGIKHVIDPGSGFLTQLNLYKVTSNGNINKMKDTR